MSYLNADRNTPEAWDALRLGLQSYGPVSIEEMERVFNIAMRVVDLASYRDEFMDLLRAVRSWSQSEDPADRESGALVWRDFRAAVLQRATGVRSSILRSTDKIARAVFDRFKEGLGCGATFDFGEDTPPLVFEGSGLPGDFYAQVPEKHLPLTLVKLPESAFGRVQRWMALPHEVGHALYPMIRGLKAEVEAALEAAMREAVGAGVVTLPPFALDVTEYGVRYQKMYSPEDLLATVWKAWADETQADLIGILACGPAATIEGQQILGFSPDDEWVVDWTERTDHPESHPTDYIRQHFALAALDEMGGHEALVDELRLRMRSVVEEPKAITFTWYGEENSSVVLSTPVDPWLTSARIAARLLLTRRLDALGGKSYGEVMTFTAEDQRITDDVTEGLLTEDPYFLHGSPAGALHALGAAVFAYEKDPASSDSVSATLQHFL